MQLFTDETAVVTGAGNGIGRAIAQALVREGVDTLFADLNPDTARAAAEAVQVGPGAAHVWTGDLSERGECARLVDDAHRALGKVVLFIHAASPPRRETDHLFAVDDETWIKMRAVNVDAAFYLGRQFARRMVADELAGRLLLVTSLHAGTPRNLPHYSASKAAMKMLVKEFAKSLGRYGIRANALVPGAIAAGGFVAQPEMVRHIPLGRLGTADDLAPMALAVLSERVGGYVTGASIVVDGGIALSNWFGPPEFDPAADHMADQSPAA